MANNRKYKGSLSLDWINKDLFDDAMERKGFSSQKITSLDDLTGSDELRNTRLSKKEYINGQIPDLFEK